MKILGCDYEPFINESDALFEIDATIAWNPVIAQIAISIVNLIFSMLTLFYATHS